LRGSAMSENHFGALLIAAPLGVRNVPRRLEQVRRTLDAGRAERAIDSMGLMAPVLARLPGPMLRALAASAPRPDILAGSLLGPGKPTYIAGAKILKSYTFGPAPGVAAMFTMQSLGHGCSISINYDPAAITHSDLFAECLTRGFSETLRYGGKTPRLGPVVIGRMRDQEMAA
jgi:diacylglycerol O-acyltransferase